MLKHSPIAWVSAGAIALLPPFGCSEHAEEPAVKGNDQQSESSGDRIDHPPPRRVFDSPGGVVAFIVEAPEGWASTLVTGRLVRTDPDRTVWSVTLPMPYGPRRAAALDSGVVVTIDEWLNIKSEHAVVVYGPEGRVIGAHTYDDVRRVMGVDDAEMTARSTSGWWVAGDPVVSGTGDAVLVACAGARLRIDTGDGSLARAEP